MRYRITQLKGTIMYLVIDIKTKQVISTHATLKAASRKCDRLDNEYGAVRYVYQYKAV